MIYTLIKLPIRLALKIFCVDIFLVNPHRRFEKGPLLLVANHPNSFLDAIIIASQFSQPVYFLARGDAFRKPWHRFFLSLLHMVPIYRLSEGRENLHLNEYAFQKSQTLLAEGKIVLLFIEGICLNTHELQPFKKGAARIALTAVGQNLSLRIMPVTIAYNSFTQTGKSVRIYFGSPVLAEQLLPYNQEAQNFLYFNEQIFDQINGNIQIPTTQELQKNILFIMLSVLGIFLHRPFYTLLKKFVRSRTDKTVFYDSVLFGMLLLLYPVYLLMLLALMAFVHLPVITIVTVLLLHPLSAWFAVRYKIKPQTSS